MEEWVHRALARWPNVPAVFGWLRLDRRGRWLIKDELISRPQIIETINRNYAADEHGRWFFQNGPQRGYVTLDATPLVLHALEGTHAALVAHTGERIERVRGGFIDESGDIVLETGRGAGLLSSGDLPWLLQHLSHRGEPLSEEVLAEVLALPHGSDTPLVLDTPVGAIALARCDERQLPQTLGFVRVPQG